MRLENQEKDSVRPADDVEKQVKEQQVKVSPERRPDAQFKVTSLH